MIRSDGARLSAALVALLSSGVALPEDAVPAAEGVDEPDGEAVVTGSRIRRPDGLTAAPVRVIDRAQIAASGWGSLGDLLRTLPDQGNALDTGVNYGGDGSTRVNLRGIGAQRTLVLVNGRRWMPGGDGANASVDVDSIPTVAVERIEVLEGGASAAYGSDAIAGVVNVILRRGGGKADASLQTGTSGRGDGTTLDAGVTAGVASDRGSALLSAGYFEQREVMARDRAFSRFLWNFDSVKGRYPAGSGTIPAGQTLETGQTGGTALWNALVGAGGSSFVWTDEPAGTGYAGYPVYCGGNAVGRTSCYRQFAGTGLREAGEVGDGYNFATETYLVTPQRRIQLYSTADLKLGRWTRAFLEASYVNRSSGQALAPEPFAGDSEFVVASAASVYNPFGVDVYVRRRLVEFGRRETEEGVHAYRVVGGLEGTTPDAWGALSGWSWDVELLWGRTDATVTRTGGLYVPALAAALGPSMVIGGTPACVSTPGDPYSSFPGCVPLDLFGGPGSITPDQVAALTFTGTSAGRNELWSVQANAGRALFRLASERPVAIAVGYEHRDLSGAYTNDPLTAKGLTSGGRRVDTRGGYGTDEGYGELAIPIASGFRGLDDLEATASARAFHSDTFGGGTAWTLGARWRPVADVTLRGSYATAFRAPSIEESFGGWEDNFPSVKDPCRGPSVGGPPVGAGCIAAGVPATGSGDTSTMLHSIVGGNPDVGPETSRGWAVGIVLEPRWTRNLLVTLDYHDLQIDGIIEPRGVVQLLGGCFSGVHPEYCSRIARDPSTHFIDAIYDLEDNVGKLSTAGVDLGVRYALPTRALGRLGFGVDATWLQRIDRTLPDGTVVHGKSTFDLTELNSPGGSGGTFPAWKANAGVTWGRRGLGAGVSTRYIGGFHECGAPYDSNGDGIADAASWTGYGPCYRDARFQREVAAYHAEDAFVSYAFRSGAGRTQLLAGVRNLGDMPPATIYNGFAASTDQYTYDQMGRFFYLRVEQTY